MHLVGDRGRLRQVMEICTVPPQLSDDEFVLEPLFRRERARRTPGVLRPGRAGCGAGEAHQPGPAPGHHGAGPVRGIGDPAVTLLIAFLAAVATYLLVSTLTRQPAPPAPRAPPDDPAAAPGLELRLRQAGVSLSPARYRATVAGSMVAMFVVGYGLTGTLALAVVPAAVVGFAPRAYYRRRQRKALAARMAAWPEAIRDVLSPHHRRLDAAQRVGAARPVRSGTAAAGVAPLRPQRRGARGVRGPRTGPRGARRPGVGPGDRSVRRRPRTRPDRRRRRAANPRR